MSKKTDNANISAKLDLRRHFLARYGGDNVIDCCQGSKKIWSQLLTEYPVTTYLGVDVKPQRGRLAVDSQRILDQPGWDFSVIDIDTYGSPWSHYLAACKYGRHDLTVFLTIGLVKVMGGQVSKEVVAALGLDALPRLPTSLAAKLSEFSLPYCLRLCEQYGYTIVEALQANRTKTAQYVGLRLSKTT